MKVKLIPVIPQTGQQTLEGQGNPGESGQWEIRSYPYTRFIRYWIPTQMAATITLNGNPILDVGSGQGASDVIEAPPGDWFDVDIIQIEAANLGNQPQDVALWLGVTQKPPNGAT